MAAEVDQAPEAVKLLTGHLTIWQTPDGRALLAFKADGDEGKLVNQEMAPMLAGPLVQLLTGQPLELPALPGPMAAMLQRMVGNGGR